MITATYHTLDYQLNYIIILYVANGQAPQLNISWLALFKKEVETAQHFKMYIIYCTKYIIRFECVTGKF